MCCIRCVTLVSFANPTSESNNSERHAGGGNCCFEVDDFSWGCLVSWDPVRWSFVAAFLMHPHAVNGVDNAPQVLINSIEGSLWWRLLCIC